MYMPLGALTRRAVFYGKTVCLHGFYQNIHGSSSRLKRLSWVCMSILTSRVIHVILLVKGQNKLQRKVSGYYSLKNIGKGQKKKIKCVCLYIKEDFEGNTL